VVRVMQPLNDTWKAGATGLQVAANGVNCGARLGRSQKIIILAGKLYNMQPSMLFVRVIIPGTYTSPRSSRTNMYPILKPRMSATGSRKRSKPHNMNFYHRFHLRCLQRARQSPSFLCSWHPNRSSATNMAPNIIPSCSRP
jgi:hypothetical protein